MNICLQFKSLTLGREVPALSVTFTMRIFLLQILISYF